MIHWPAKMNSEHGRSYLLFAYTPRKRCHWLFGVWLDRRFWWYYGKGLFLWRPRFKRVWLPLIGLIEYRSQP